MAEFLEDFVDTGDDIQLGHTTLSLFRREVEAGDSIVMTGNSDSQVPEEARMYVVLAKQE